MLLLVAAPIIGIASCSGDTARDDSRRDRARIPDIAAVADSDDFGQAVPTDARFAERVVSLNPAATELIFAIGADARLVGRSRWDEHPVEAQRVPAVGDGIRPNIEAVLALRPTLVILYATAENHAAEEAFRRAGVRTLSLRVDHVAQFLALTRTIGVALGAEEAARIVRDSVQHTLDQVRAATQGAPRVSAAWPLWQQPVMVVGRGSYLDELLEIAGGRNVFHDLEAPSPLVNIEEIARRDPDVLIASARTRVELMSKPQWRAVRAVRDDHWVLDDPALTGRPSVVLGMAAVSLARALHPELAARLPELPPQTPATQARP